MIGDILSGNEKSKCVLIEDSVQQTGLPLLASAICELCKRMEKVHVFCFHRNPAYIQSYLPQQALNRLVFHDGSKDPLGVHNPDGLNVTSDLVHYLDSLPTNHAHHSMAIVIDNLSLSLLHRNAPFTCQTLAQLKDAKVKSADVEQVVCLLHSDLHDDHSLTLVRHLATSIVKVIPPQLDTFFMATQTTQKRLSGKVVKMTEHFNMDAGYSVFDVTEVKSISSAPATNSVTGSQPDPTANLTFNLSLTDSEKEARSQVKLPYTYDKNRQDETLSKSVGEGKIFYQPDEADDFDEDDPDDDLDI